MNPVIERGIVKLSSLAGRTKQLLSMLLIAVPWFLRDNVAAEFEKRSQDLQSAITETDNQALAEEQAADQREVIYRLRAIHALAEGDASEGNAKDAESRMLKDEGHSARPGQATARIGEITDRTTSQPGRYTSATEE